MVKVNGIARKYDKTHRSIQWALASIQLAFLWIRMHACMCVCVCKCGNVHDTVCMRKSEVAIFTFDLWKHSVLLTTVWAQLSWSVSFWVSPTSVAHISTGASIPDMSSCPALCGLWGYELRSSGLNSNHFTHRTLSLGLMCLIIEVCVMHYFDNQVCQR